MSGSGVHGIHFKDRITAEDVLGGPDALSTPRGGKHQTQSQIVKQQLHNQKVRLREAFIREDTLLTGTIPSYLVPTTLKCGGLELSKDQVAVAKKNFMTGDGRFNWELFCDNIETARKSSWSDAARLKSAKAFQEIDADGSGRISRDELTRAMKKFNMATDEATVEKLLTSCDADGDGNISYPEFVDGLARDLVAPNSVFKRLGTAASRRRQ